MNHFSIRLWYAIKSLFYTTTSGYHLSGWTEKKLQSTFQSQTHTHTHTHTERIMVTVVLSDTSLICYSFLNPCKSITSEKYAQQINGMHQNPQCLQLVLVHRKGLILSCDNTWPHVVRPMLQMLKELGCKVLPHLPFSPALSPTDYHFLKQLNNFCRENSTASRTQKMLSNGSSNPRAQIFMLQE